MTLGSMLKRNYLSVDSMFVVGCYVVFAVRALDTFQIFELMVPCMFCTVLLPFVIQMHNLDAFHIMMVASITLLFLLQFRTQTPPTVPKYVGDGKCRVRGMLFIEVNLNMAWGWIPMVWAVQCFFMYCYGSLNIFKMWWIEYLVFQGTFFMFTLTLCQFMAKEQSSVVQRFPRTRHLPSTSEGRIMRMHHENFEEQYELTTENVGDYVYKSTARQASSNDLHGKQLVLNHKSTWWAFWPFFVSMFCLVMLCAYQKRGSFGFFSAFSCDLILSFLLILAFYIAIDHATKIWRVNDEKAVMLYFMITTLIIMVGDIDVTPGVPFTMPELLTTWYCLSTGNSVPAAIWAIAKLKSMVNARKTDPADSGVEETTPVCSGGSESIWTWMKKQLFNWTCQKILDVFKKQFLLWVLDSSKNMIWNCAEGYVLSIMCKCNPEVFKALVCSTTF